MKNPYIVPYHEEEKTEKPNIQFILLVMITIFSGYLYMKVQAMERKIANALTSFTTFEKANSITSIVSPTIFQEVITATVSPTLEFPKKISPIIKSQPLQ